MTSPFFDPIQTGARKEMLKRLGENAAVKQSLETMPADLQLGVNESTPEFLAGMLLGLVRFASVTKMMTSAAIAENKDEAKKIQAVAQAIVYIICQKLENPDG